jgi:hypothetical protein
VNEEPTLTAEAEAARQAFAEESGADAADISIVDVEPVTWSDSSLGCGEPGMSYLQVLTPGYKVTLELEGRRAVYHTDRATDYRPPTVVRCDKALRSGPFEPVKPPRLDDMAAPAVEAARVDLESRVAEGTELTLEDLQISDVTDLVCDDSSVVTPGAGPAKVILEIQLRAGDDVHVYRAWSDEVLYCGLRPGPAVE